jgi:heme exporter protein CcmD
MSDFFAMGGYGAYIWPAYGATVFAFALAVIAVWRGYARAKARLAQASEKS